MKRVMVLAGLVILWFFLSGFTTYTQTGPTGFSWDAVTVDIAGNPVTIDHYEIKLIREVTLEEHTYATAGTTISIPKPKSGKWEARIRTVRLNGEGLPVYSDWCTSMNVRIDINGNVVPCLPCTCSKLKDGTYGDWKVYWKPSGVIGPVIIIPKQVPK